MRQYSVRNVISCFDLIIGVACLGIYSYCCIDRILRVLLVLMNHLGILGTIIHWCRVTTESVPHRMSQVSCTGIRSIDRQTEFLLLVHITVSSSVLLRIYFEVLLTCCGTTLFTKQANVSNLRNVCVLTPPFSRLHLHLPFGIINMGGGRSTQCSFLLVFPLHLRREENTQQRAFRFDSIFLLRKGSAVPRARASWGAYFVVCTNCCTNQVFDFFHFFQDLRICLEKNPTGFRTHNLYTSENVTNNQSC